MCCVTPEWDSHEGNRFGFLRGLVACKTLSPLGESFGVKIHPSHRRHVTSSIDLTSFAPNFTDSLLLGPCGDLVPLHAIDMVAQNGKRPVQCSQPNVFPGRAQILKNSKVLQRLGILKCDSQVSLFTGLLHHLGQPFFFKYHHDEYGFLYICVEKINSPAAVLSLNGAAPKHHERNCRYRNVFQNRHKLE